METLSQNKQQTRQTASTHLSKLLAFAQQNDAALAFWRLPNDSKIQILCDLSGGQKIEDLNLEDLKPGFLLHPFQTDQDHIVHFKAEILAEIKLRFDSKASEQVVEIDWKQTPSQDIENQIETICTEFDFNKLPAASQSDETTQSDYMQLVSQAIDLIKKELFYKVVPSKIKISTHQNDLNLADTFLAACQRYPNAFVNLTYSAQSGLWFGASPETLIEEKKGEYFKTMALAGTQLKTEKNISETSWTQKEIEEQAYVSRYIINCFKQIRLREYDEIGPKTIQAGNLLHLKTTFKVNTAVTNFPELGSVMLKLLHPTSAVCGMPKVSALEFLRKHEKHQRAYFSGFLGPVHMDKQSHLFVNLRCCQINHKAVTFYAGAGITEDSKAEKEWEETEMKCSVLSKIVFH